MATHKTHTHISMAEKKKFLGRAGVRPRCVRTARGHAFFLSSVVGGGGCASRGGGAARARPAGARCAVTRYGLTAPSHQPLVVGGGCHGIGCSAAAGGTGDGAGAMRDGCIDDGDGLETDREWVAAPDSHDTPCCSNTSIIFASLYLNARAEYETTLGTGDGYANDDLVFLEACVLSQICRNTDELFAVSAGEVFHCELRAGGLEELKEMLLRG